MAGSVAGAAGTTAVAVAVEWAVAAILEAAVVGAAASKAEVAATSVAVAVVVAASRAAVAADSEAAAVGVAASMAVDVAWAPLGASALPGMKSRATSLVALEYFA